MKIKSLTLWSICISIVSLIMSVCALVRNHPTSYVTFDYMGVIVGILALLITALIGAQVSQYIFVDRKIEKVASKITRIIAHKSANDISRRVAAETATEAVRNIPADMAAIFNGKDIARGAELAGSVGKYMECIDKTFAAISAFSKCSNDVIYKTAVKDSLETLKNVFEVCREKGGARILAGKRESYLSVLQGIRNLQTEFYSQYLQEAQEQEPSFDENLLHTEIGSWFQD